MFNTVRKGFNVIILVLYLYIGIFEILLSINLLDKINIEQWKTKNCFVKKREEFLIYKNIHFVSQMKILFYSEQSSYYLSMRKDII